MCTELLQEHGVHIKVQIHLARFVEVSYKHTHLLESNGGATKLTGHLLQHEPLEYNHFYDLDRSHLPREYTLYHFEPCESRPFEHKHLAHHSDQRYCPKLDHHHDLSQPVDLQSNHA